MTLTSLPTEYTFGKVVARIIQAVADGSDEDRYPDMIAATGVVTFKPKQKQRKTADYRALVLNQPIRCRLYSPQDWEDPAHPPGTLIDPQGNIGVWLTVGSYDVEFQLNQGGFAPMEITVMEEHTKKNPLDLIEYAPPPQTENVIMVTAVIPPGGAPHQTLVRQPNGELGWQDILDDETARRAETAAQQSEVHRGVAESEANALRAMIPNISTGDTPPPNPNTGDLWFDTSERGFYDLFS